MKNGLKLKVCGMREAENILSIAALGPDYIGFIFYPASPRYVGRDFAIPPGFPASVRKVGVFVNASSEEMLNAVATLSLDFLQLHGNEPPNQVKELQQSGVRVIKAFSIDEQFDFTKLNSYEAYVDFFLFDTKGKLYGGNAMAFDWQILKRYNLDTPFFLSGGLSHENVGNVQMLGAMNIHALDINSGVEVSPGVKDPALVEQIRRHVLEVSDQSNQE